MKSLIIGYGEIGKGLHKVIGGDYLDTRGGKFTEGKYDIIHICFPYFKGFIKEVKYYAKRFQTDLVLVHSTVPMGTCRKIGCAHSPVRGVHPNLDKGIKTFVKFIGGFQAKECAKFLNKKGIKTWVVKDSNTTEAMKLWDTTIYGALILLNKEIHDWCEKNKVEFDIVYTQASKTYNEGYAKLGRPDVMRPWLKYMEGKIGGHCVGQNVKLFNSETPKRIRKYQRKYDI